MTEVSEAAKLKACELIGNGEYDLGYTVGKLFPQDGMWDTRAAAFARYIQQVSDAADAVSRIAMGRTVTDQAIRDTMAEFILPDPVDPLLIEARTLVECWWPGEGAREGKLDNGMWTQRILAALKRGMELAGGQP